MAIVGTAPRFAQRRSGPAAANPQLQQVHLDAGSTSEWHPCFEVEDCDAALTRARELGATVIIPAMDAGGVGRLAMFLDPFGAPFAVLRSAGR